MNKLSLSNLYVRLWIIAVLMGGLIVAGYIFVVRHHGTVPKVPVSSVTSAAQSKDAASAPADATTVAPSTGVSSSQVKVYDSHGALQATFTIGSRTVLINGPSRTFAEPNATDATVTTTSWVRLYPTVFTGSVDKVWLAKMVASNNSSGPPDILGTAMQYISGAPKIRDASGRVIAGDASFGPMGIDGHREEGADFNDFLGIPWTYGSTVDKPEPAQLGSLDCSGFQRMVWGYRSGLRLELSPTGDSLPRRAYQILKSGPGIVITPDTRQQVTDFSRMQIGDVAFLDVDADDGPQVDHMGIYFGVDSQGHHRFLSSRKMANGPTFGDIDGKAILDGSGYFAQRFRAVRRF